MGRYSAARDRGPLSQLGAAKLVQVIGAAEVAETLRSRSSSDRRGNLSKKEALGTTGLGQPVTRRGWGLSSEAVRSPCWFSQGPPNSFDSAHNSQTRPPRPSTRPAKRQQQFDCRRPQKTQCCHGPQVLVAEVVCALRRRRPTPRRLCRRTEPRERHRRHRPRALRPVGPDLPARGPNPAAGVHCIQRCVRYGGQRRAEPDRDQRRDLGDAKHQRWELEADRAHRWAHMDRAGWGVSQRDHDLYPILQRPVAVLQLPQARHARQLQNGRGHIGQRGYRHQRGAPRTLHHVARRHHHPRDDQCRCNEDHLVRRGSHHDAGAQADDNLGSRRHHHVGPPGDPRRRREDGACDDRRNARPPLCRGHVLRCSRLQQRGYADYARTLLEVS
ncbi:hypothetical protein DFJ74DRAFT_672309 [Hyaloraphidium curvatum]|nr:hypothetical protein DFJ74DRAFT_672309 [Hyaloraphidium curvatum]